MTRVVLAVIWAGALLVAGWLVIHGEGRASAARIEERLQRAAETALFVAGLDDWARVRVSGQSATVSGQAPREEERAAARGVVRRAAGPGGALIGGVTRVRDATTLAEAMSPYVWRASREASGVVLSGGAPSRAARQELAQYARQLFPAGVVDHMRVARGAPDEIAWAAAARAGLAQLAQMQEGQVVITDLAIEVEGVVPNKAARERVAEALARAPAVFQRYVDVEALDGSAPAPAPEAEAGPAPLTTPQACAAALNGVLADGLVQFETEGAALAKESYPALDQAAAVALRCLGLRVVARGVTRPAAPDDDGEAADDVQPAVSPELARARAQTVADYLVLKGVAPERSLADVRAQAADGPRDVGAIVFDVRD